MYGVRTVMFINPVKKSKYLRFAEDLAAHGLKFQIIADKNDK